MELVVEPYAPGDEKRMMEIAPRAFEVWARYGIDYSLPRERVDEAYRLEAQGYADRARRGDEGFAVFTAKREGLLIGYIVVCVDPHRSQLFGLRWGVIVSLAVDPDFHHQGTGKALVRRAMEWFREQGCEYLEVTTDLNNVAAIRTYEGAGFRAIYASITLSQQ
ncbi:MAG: GNAT family N-acetyltransferase, partial [Armatimonadetes bacterium]|nr:GNAT family N-acetyltransferase [Armatimonadota bacterium]